MVTSLVLVRHGQSTWNAEGRWQGQADPPLSPLGREQAQAAGPRLRALGGRLGLKPIDAAVTSPQRRAGETAALLVAALPTVAVDRLETRDDLRERSAGPWSGLTKADIEVAYPGFLAGDERPEGYEADGPLYDRIERTLTELGTSFPDRSVLVVCHGGVINTVANRLGGPPRRVPNLSGIVVGVMDGDLNLVHRFDLLDADRRTGGDTRRV